MTVLTPHRVRRLDDGRLEHFFPSVDADGMYELGDPSVGSKVHHKDNAIFVRSLTTALHLVRKHRFSIRMKGNVTGQRNLISADKIECLG